MNGPLRGFTTYLDHRSLPFRSVDVRRVGNPNVTLALIDHAPSPGIEYPPVDDLIVSIVVRSNHGMVERDVGSGRQVFRETPWSILVTPPRTTSYWAFSGTPQVIHVAIASSYVDQFLHSHTDSRARTLMELASGPILDPLITLLTTRLWLASADNTLLGTAFTERAADLLLPSLLRRDVPAAKGDASGTGLTRWRYTRATSLMEQLDVKFSVAQVASEVGLSRSHFVRAFKATTGQSPYQWICAKRIDRAKQMLRESHHSLTHIATTLGYSSASHFSAAFRTATGVSPRAWRQEFSED